MNIDREKNVGSREIIRCGECRHYLEYTETDERGTRTYRRCIATLPATATRADGDCMAVLGAARRQTGEKHEGNDSQSSDNPADHRPDDPLHQGVNDVAAGT